MYKIIGSDNLEYGPVSTEVIRQWIAEGRLNAQSKLRAETSPDWLPLSAFPEFAADLAPRVSSSLPPTLPAPMPPYHTVPNPSATNKLAIAGFVCSLLGLVCCCGLLSIPGLIMSIIALSQIRQNPVQGGRGLAIAGIIIAIVALIWNVISTMIFLANPQGLDQIFNNLK